MLPRTNAVFVAEIAAMWRRAAIISLAGLSCGLAAADPAPAPASNAAIIAQPVPLPWPRPPKTAPPPWAPRADWTEPRSFREAAGPDFKSDEATSEPSACRLRLEKFAVVEAMPRLIGPGACGGDDVVRLDAVLLAGGKRIEIKPAPYLRCPMAEQLALFVRDDAVPQVAATGAVLREVATYDDFDCRGRNRKLTGKVSEHGKANAVDLRGLTFTDGRFAKLTDINVSKPLRDSLRQSACARFTTVLGPGSDGYHEEHIHLDFAQRHNGYRICQWDVRKPLPPPLPPKPPEPKAPEPAPGAASEVPVAAPTAVTFPDNVVPLPRARPKTAEKPQPRRKSRAGFHLPFNLLR
jgi:hypothetical protein